MNRIPLIIDTDPGIDDVMMLTFAFANEEAFDIRLITTCSGNISQDRTNYNARAFLSYIGANVEIARGLDRPFFRELELADHIHGESGLGNVEFPPPSLPVSKRPAVTAMVETILQSDEKVTIVATGPLTNVAAMLLAHPEVKPKIERISWMGGAAVGGNTSPTAEFNAYVDPHAVEIVLRSGVPVVMSGLDVTHKAFVTQEEAKVILSYNTEFAQKTYQLLTYYFNVMEKTPFHEENYDQVLRFHDVCAMMYLLRPEIFKGQDCYVEMVLEGPAAGTTMVDYINRWNKAPNVHVLHSVNREVFVDEYIKAVKTISDKIHQFN